MNEASELNERPGHMPLAESPDHGPHSTTGVAADNGASETGPRQARDSGTHPTSSAAESASHWQELVTEFRRGKWTEGLGNYLRGKIRLSDQRPESASLKLVGAWLGVGERTIRRDTEFARQLDAIATRLGEGGARFVEMILASPGRIRRDEVARVAASGSLNPVVEARADQVPAVPAAMSESDTGVLPTAPSGDMSASPVLAGDIVTGLFQVIMADWRRLGLVSDVPDCDDGPAGDGRHAEADERVDWVPAELSAA